MSKISKLLVLALAIVSCSTVEDIKDSAIDTVDDIVPLDIKGKDKTVYGTKDYADAIVSRLEPKWFIGDDRFQLSLSSENRAQHLFYDVKPDINFNSYKLNFVVTAPEDSDTLYGIDITSGQHYTDKVLCEQNDVFKKYSKTIYKPPFTVGIVPRMLDQLGTPQKIIVFGDKKYYEKNFRDHFFDVRVIGGFIERVCPLGACERFEDLNARSVIVAVQSGSKKYADIRSIEQLRLKVDWNAVKAFVENGFGKNHTAGSYYPAYRMGSELTALQVMTSIRKNSIYLTNKKLNRMRNSCYRLYDYVWKDVAQNSEIEKKMLAAKDFKTRKEIYRTTYKVKDRFFFQRFIKAFRRYGDEYATCVKYVYPSNINYSAERHWFLTFYSAIHLLNDLGYSFDCGRSLWIKNPVLSSGKKAISKKMEFKGCSARQIDMAFEYATGYLENLRFKNYPSYRYIDYDRNSIGTHNKIYSWVYQENKKLQCFGKQSDLVLKQPGFPKDVKWRRRTIPMKKVSVVK